MRATIHVEGGGDTELTLRSCRAGFAQYCEKIAVRERCFRIVACGGRNQAYSDFIAELSATQRGDHCVLLVDSEGPVAAGTTPQDYLRLKEGWTFSSAGSQRVFLMVQAMEAWLLADRSTLAAFYGSGFRTANLPGDELHIERIRKEDLEPALERAARDTKKGRYHKTRHGFVLIGLIDPLKVKASSPHAADLDRFVRTL